MKAKLTLTVERETAAQAKRLARKGDISVSALFEEWLQKKGEAEERRPRLGARLRGRWKAGAEDTSETRLDHLLKKHSSR